MPPRPWWGHGGGCGSAVAAVECAGQVDAVVVVVVGEEGGVAGGVEFGEGQCPLLVGEVDHVVDVVEGDEVWVACLEDGYRADDVAGVSADGDVGEGPGHGGFPCSGSLRVANVGALSGRVGVGCQPRRVWCVGGQFGCERSVWGCRIGRSAWA